MTGKTKKIIIGGIVLFLVVCLFIAVRSFVVLALYNATGVSDSGGGYSEGFDSVGLSDTSMGSSLWGSVGINSSIPSSAPNVNRQLKNEADYNEDSSQTATGDLTKKKIIKNASLTIYVKDAEKIAQEIQALANGMGGFVASSNIYDNKNGEKLGRITIRVPADKFENTLNNTKQLAEEVEKESISAQDVTEQYVDLEAQLRNLRAEESQYLKILEKSYTIKDTLDVTQRLSNVRGQIERIQGQLQYLSRQVDMSTINIELKADADVEVFGLRWRPLIVAKQALRGMFSGLSTYVDKMIVFLFQLPVIILWVITFVFGAWVTWRLLWWLKKLFIVKKNLK